MDTPQSTDTEVLPGPPPQLNVQQHWLPQSGPAAHPGSTHAAPPGAEYQGYGAQYFFQHSGGIPAAQLHPATTVRLAAEDDRYATS